MRCTTAATACASGFKVNDGSNGCVCRRCLEEYLGESNEILYERDIKVRETLPNNACTYSKYTPIERDLCPRRVESPDLFGFDTYINITIGANLYGIITVYGKGELYIPFRINLPEFDNRVCADVSDSCTNNNNNNNNQLIQASFWTNMSVSFYLGIAVEFNNLKKIINEMINTGILDIIDEEIDLHLPSYEKLIGTYQIFNKTFLGCTRLGNTLDTIYKQICCDESGPIFIDLNNNGIHDTNEIASVPATTGPLQVDPEPVCRICFDDVPVNR